MVMGVECEQHVTCSLDGWYQELLVMGTTVGKGGGMGCGLGMMRKWKGEMCRHWGCGQGHPPLAWWN